jgi:hypothetical protein
LLLQADWQMLPQQQQQQQQQLCLGDSSVIADVGAAADSDMVHVGVRLLH